MIPKHRTGGAAAAALSLLASAAHAGEHQWPDLVEPGTETAPASPAERSDQAATTAETASGAAAAPAAAERDLTIEAGDFSIRPRAQYRLRYRHHEGHDFTEGGISDTLRHRARLGVGISWPKWSDRLGVLVELQDVRTFGEETSTTRDYAADGFDLHQGYGYLRMVRSFTMRFGRQEIFYENGRLLGLSDWQEPARSYDAVRFSYDDAGLQVDSFYAKIRETNVGLGIDAEPSGGRHLLAGNLHYDLMRELGAGVLVTSDLTELDGRKQTTAGALVAGEAGESTTFSYAADGYYQFGSAYGDTSFSSFLVGAEARLTLGVPGRPYLEGVGVLLSGDDDPDDLTARTFELPFGGNHVRYGEMDFFIDMPRDTDQRGLRDLGGALGAKPTEAVHLRAAYHLMQAMADRPDGLRTFGHELDVKGEYRFWTYARAAVFYGVFFPQGLFERGVAGPGAEHFAYVTLDLKLE
ncbi:MAG: alginate export family protein [Deltaproteobacteria bacterium]|jgi:hypothetical protein|nr:alginate export family protein [Deltaproteobacteria bacterium]MBW2529882.1 alginate export family protein [Deltaproteobacteria bacterium]